MGSAWSTFVILGPRLRDLGAILRAVFTDDWVATYQVGFGPPLVRSSGRLLERLRDVRGALDKLDVYMDVCLFDERERTRLAQLHRQLQVRRNGPVEAETIKEASAQVLDLSCRLYEPQKAPPKVQDAMEDAGVSLSIVPDGLSPEEQSARFWIHLHDPRNERLLHIERVDARLAVPEQAVALELRVPAFVRPLWQAWAKSFEARTHYAVVDLKEPVSYARVHRDGERL